MNTHSEQPSFDTVFVLNFDKRAEYKKTHALSWFWEMKGKTVDQILLLVGLDGSLTHTHKELKKG